ncbi:MAG: asparagine synthase (glutamine-hydrolyzing) [Myxococcales bacterium]|nr:asparagine synthase (glutamine-hydrolyzing) [Myxococcales bacterium]
MCGFVGFLGDFSFELLQEMNQRIAHRGPDDSGTYYQPEQQVGLGHQRLSIIDLSELGHQPMFSEDRRVVIVFNGEIYNFRELRRSLERDGYSFRGHSDTEVLLQLYRRDGEKMLAQLNGIFAFAIWDHDRKKILLARDGVGIKPLYYTKTRQGVLFASELKSLLCHPDVDRSLDLHSIHHHLTYQWCPHPGTVLRSIKKLPPGHLMWLDASQDTDSYAFYDLPYDQPVEPIREEDAIRLLQKQLSLAVERQLVSDVPVGAFLSGGLDSSSLVALTQRIAHQSQRKCFTIGFQGEANPKGEGRVDDLPYAKRVAQDCDIDLHTVYVGPEMTEHLERMIYHLDEPQADFAPLHVYFICQLARQQGIKVLLSGTGGDDLFTGYRRHQALFYERAWGWLPQPIRKLIRTQTGHLSNLSTMGRRINKAFQYADLTQPERIVAYFHCLPPEIIHSLYTPDAKAQVADLSFSAPLTETLSKLPPNTDPINQMLYLEGKHFLPDHNLNYTDKMSMATGVEVRVPFLDPDLIRFATSLPVDLKQTATQGKYILKRAMEPYLPHDVIYRPKTGFGVPMRRWLKVELRDVVEDVLSPHNLKQRGLFEPTAVHNLLEQDRKGYVDGSYLIFALVTLELWMRIFIDRKTSWF